MEKLLFENKFDVINEVVKTDIVEAEQDHGGTSTGDIAVTIPKFDFAKATLSRTLPALVGYVQKINSPSGYIFAMRPQSGYDAIGPVPKGIDPLDPDNTEYRTVGNVPPETIISVNGARGYDQAEDAMIVRKAVTTTMREVKIITTNEVEQDINALFGNNFEERYMDYLSVPEYESGSVNLEQKKLSKFFFDYGSTQMVKKTNKAFTDYLGTVATPLGTVDIALADILSAKISIALGQMQSALIGGRKKVAGRFWIIADASIASILGSLSGISNDDIPNRIPSTLENTFVTTVGNIDVYASPDITNGTVYMGVIGNGNISSIYYTPYNEYMVHSGDDPYHGQSNVFFRVRDDWCTNPLDTFTDAQPDSSNSAVTEVTNRSDYVVKAVINIPNIIIYATSVVATNISDITVDGATSQSTILITYSDASTSTDATKATWAFVTNTTDPAIIDGSGLVTASSTDGGNGTVTFTATVDKITSATADVVITNQSTT